MANELENVEETVDETPKEENNELAKLKAELAKQKAALDKATKEAAESKRELRKKQSAEEVAAEEAKALQQAMEEELAQLRKEEAGGRSTAKAMGVVNDSDVASQLAEYLYGAEDADAALTAIQKVWNAKEKALRLEFGKIPAPSAGSSEGTMFTKEQLDGLSFPERVKFANEHPEEYNKLMGR